MSGFVLLSLALALSLAACGPSGTTENLSPAFLEVEPLAFQFGAEDDTESLLVKNAGGKSLAFSLQVNAVSDGVTWLKVEPDGGAVEGGGTVAIVVRVINRDKLAPGNYQGKILVSADNVDSHTVSVSVEVGQPILSVEPPELIDFGSEETTQKLTIKNAGQGRLTYSATLPGNWVTTTDPLFNEALPNESQTILLTVDRLLVPWYGVDTEILLVSSNGLEDGTNGANAELQVRVEIDPSCEVDAHCLKLGYYCDHAEGVGQCTAKGGIGDTCEAFNQCSSGFCVDGYCCDGPCDGQCLSCKLTGMQGTCTPREDGIPCDDEDLCTDDDACEAGECVPGDSLDCSDEDTECGQGVCDPETGECKPDLPDDKCAMDGKCWEADEVNPEVDCLLCRPDDDQAGWSVIEGMCYIDKMCLQMGEALDESGCVVCNPGKPFFPSVVSDGTECTDDGNSCTADECKGGTPATGTEGA